MHMSTLLDQSARFARNRAVARRTFMREIVSFLLKNFLLTFLCMGLVVSAVSLLGRRKRRSLTNAMFAWKTI